MEVLGGFCECLVGGLSITLDGLVCGHDIICIVCDGVVAMVILVGAILMVVATVNLVSLGFNVTGWFGVDVTVIGFDVADWLGFSVIWIVDVIGFVVDVT